MKQTKKEFIKQRTKLSVKYQEYINKTTEELEELLPKLGGGYKQVCLIILKDRYLRKTISNQDKEISEGEVL